MFLYTRKYLAAKAAERWHRSYFKEGDWVVMSLDSEGIYNKLVALGANPCPDEVDGVIGNNSWTRCRCDNCGNGYEAVVQVGEAPDYDSSTAAVCRMCLNEAIKLIEG